MWVPTTSVGRLAVLGMATFLGLMALFAILVASGQRGGEGFIGLSVTIFGILEVAFPH